MTCPDGDREESAADTVPFPVAPARRVRVRLHPPTPATPRTAAGRAGWALLLI